jgi:hypothetical protein
MWRCPKCDAEVSGSLRACWVCGSTADGVEAAGLPPPAPSEVAVDAIIVEDVAPRRPPSPQVGVPRRFGIGTMMILTAMYAVLFSLLTTLGAPPVVFAAIAIYVTGVGLCQVLLYKGKNPRRASIVGGAVLYSTVVIIGVGNAIFSHSTQMPSFYSVCLFLGGAVVFGAIGLLFGGLLGYVVGCFIAAIFLVKKEPQDE